MIVMDDNEAMAKQMGTVSVGDDLYGVSVKELELRIDILKREIERTRSALSKKSAELSEAETLFAPRKTD